MVWPAVSSCCVFAEWEMEMDMWGDRSRGQRRLMGKRLPIDIGSSEPERSADTSAFWSLVIVLVEVVSVSVRSDTDCLRT